MENVRNIYLTIKYIFLFKIYKYFKKRQKKIYCEKNILNPIKKEKNNYLKSDRKIKKKNSLVCDENNVSNNLNWKNFASETTKCK